MKNKPNKALLWQAIQEAGGVMAVTKHFKYAFPSAVYNWTTATAKNGSGIPVKCAIKLCKMKGVTLTPEKLRPDIYS